MKAGLMHASGWAAVAAIAAIGALAAAPSGASAAICPATPGVFTTTWIGGSGHYNTDANWSNGAPSGACDASIVAPGNYTVTMNAGSVAKSMTIGGAGSTPTLQISAENANTNLLVTTSALTIASGAGITLLCNVPPESCGAPNLSAPTISNAGTIAVGATVNGMPFISGALTNTGTMQFNHTAKFNNAAVTNQGAVNIADGVTVHSGGSSCGDTGVSFKNHTGGTLNATGSGTFNVINYEQGAGSTSGTNPVQIPCGSLKYTGNGASKVVAYGGFALSGEMQAGQSLAVSGESSNTNPTLTGNFTNNGSITLTCRTTGCGGVGFNAAGNVFTNAGTFTIAPATGSGTGISSGGGGTIVNTGTMQFDQDGYLSGVVVNKGALNIADGKTATSSGSSCGDTGANVKNDVGGQINGTGTGKLSVLNYEQGAGTTSGSAPVQIPCGSLKYTGSGASTVQLNGAASMTGNIAAGQTLRLINGSTPAPPFTNAGTIIFDPSGSATLNTATLTNTGRLTGVGTLGGSVDNSTGTVAPGASPGTLTVNGNYSQGAGGTLEIEVEGTGAGQFDKLAVGGSATLGGTLALKPSAGYAASAAPGNSVQFLTYGGSRTNPFAATSVTPLTCPNVLTASYDDTGKNVAAVVSNSGGNCGGGGGGVGGGGGGTTNPPAPNPPNTVLGKRPRAKVTTKKAKVKVTFKFSSNVAGARFQCKLDKKRFAACSSPKSYKVSPGKHKFTVRAVGAGGTDATPATFSFKVVKKKKPKR